MSLENASDEVKLAVDLIMLLESHQIPAQTVLSALEIVRRDYANKLKNAESGSQNQRSRDVVSGSVLAVWSSAHDATGDNIDGKSQSNPTRRGVSPDAHASGGREGFLQLYLPAPFLAICELDSLQLVSGSFVEEDLRASYSDILYSLRTRHGPGYVYALIEHQSTPDKLMAFRLLRYALAAMQRHLDAGHDTLPLVVPILFYHGKVSPRPWARNWQQLFADPAWRRRSIAMIFRWWTSP